MATFHLDIDYRIVDNVVRWTSNDRVPFDDVLLGLERNRAITAEQRQASSKAREIEVRQFLAQMRANRHRPVSEEVRAEARAAFGPGVEVVNVVTGQRYTT